MRRFFWITSALSLLLLALWLGSGPHVPAPGAPTVASQPVPTEPTARYPSAHYPAFLPVEAHEVLRRIEAGGPFDHRQDGAVFHNREHLLPPQPRGYYREYTVPTPGAHDRGARRIVTGGGTPGTRVPSEYWYTQDHYRSFRGFHVQAAEVRR